MATVTEMMMQDAAASIETSYTMAVGDTFNGNLSSPADSDWVGIELEAGTTYVINLSGRGTGGAEAEDTVLILRDAKGGMIAMNDDIKSVGNAQGPANLNSSLRFTAEADGTYYIDASSYNRIPGSNNSGTYSISVVALDLPADIEGTELNEKINGTDGAESILGGGGDDTINAMGGDDEVDGGSGNDLIIGGPGGDMLKGGAGEDTISYEYSPMGVTLNLRSGSASGGDAEGDELGADIENVQGSMHDDDISGSRGANKLWGLGGNDSLFGDKSADELYGGVGDDNLDGGDGDDTLEGGYGADTLTGGEDDDTVSYASSMMGVTVRLHSQQAMGGDAEGDVWGDTVTITYMLPNEDGELQEHEETVPDFVHLTGSNMADILAGDSRDNTIMGMGGDDKIYGGPGGGDDVLNGGGGDDMLFGGHGNDDLHGGGGADMLNGGPGDDTFYGGLGSDMIYAGSEDTGTISGVAMEDNAMTPDLDESSMDGMGDMDTLSYARNKTAVTIDLSDARFISIETLVGTSEDDTLTGSDAAAETIEGGDGADMLVGGTAADISDTVSYENSDRRVSIDISGATDSASGGHAQGDTISGFENITGSAHDDILTGDEGANVLKGLAGDDELVGGTGSDTLEGGYGSDELDGGTAAAEAGIDTDGGADSDSDTLSYASSMAAVNANLATNTYSGGDAEGDEIKVDREAYDHDMDDETDPLDVSTFENLRGSMHNDRLTGDHRANTIMGGDGDDTISGGGDFDVLMGQKGDDTISGGAGSDHLVGGPGADRLDGGEVRGERDNMIPNPDFDPEDPTADPETILTTDLDWAVYRPAMDGVTVDLSEGRGTGGDAMGDRLIGIEVIWGSKNDDTFIASADEDTHDIIHGDSGADTVSYEASETPVMVDLADHNDNTSITLGGIGTAADPFTFTYEPTGDNPTLEHVTDAPGVALGSVETNGAFGDRLGGISNLTGSDHNDTLNGDDQPNVLKGGGGNDSMEGGGQADRLYGGDGRDILNGEAGTDTLNGGAGADELTGGGEADTFVFGPGHGDDIINDLAIGTDRIDLSAFNLDADDLAGMISTRGTGDNARVIINLSSVGGGTIELTEQDSADDLDEATGASADDSITDQATDGAIQELNVYDADSNADGVFIL